MKESEFKFFDVVEDTIKGVVAFFDRWVTTLFYLAILPHRFPKKWSEDSDRRLFVTPLTQMAISVFAFYLLLVSYSRSALIKAIGPSFLEVPSDVGHYMTLARLFGYSVPAIILLQWVGRFFGRILAPSSALRSDLTSLALYACSFQCLVLAVDIFCRPILGKLGLVFLLYGFGVSCVILYTATSNQPGLPRIRLLLITAIHNALSIGCIVAVVLIGISAEFLPAYMTHLERERRAEQAQQQRDFQAGLQPLLEEMLDKFDPDHKRREKITCAIRSVRISEDRTGFACIAILTNNTEELVHFDREAVCCHIDDMRLPAQVTPWPDAPAILMIGPSETKAIDLGFAGSSHIVKHDESLSFKLAIQCFVFTGGIWQGKPMEFGDYEFKLVDGQVAPEIATTTAKRIEN